MFFFLHITDVEALIDGGWTESCSAQMWCPVSWFAAHTSPGSGSTLGIKLDVLYFGVLVAEACSAATRRVTSCEWEHVVMPFIRICVLWLSKQRLKRKKTKSFATKNVEAIKRIGARKKKNLEATKQDTLPSDTCVPSTLQKSRGGSQCAWPCVNTCHKS